MSLESIAQVQARIASIQRSAGATSNATALGQNSSGGDFAALLAQYEGNPGLAAAGTGLGTDSRFAADQLLLNPAFGRPASGSASTATPGVGTQGVGPAGVGLANAGPAVRGFVEAALAQDGDTYVMGHEVSLDDPDPGTFDCSELVQWAAKRVGVDITDGSWLQYLDLKQRGALIPVEQALRTPGALLFSFSEEPQPGGSRPSQAHVAISLGDGRTIEARGSDYGVGIFEAGDRFEWAGVIPELA